jgi:transcriptional regulator with XRE-family HTH domain
MAPVMTKASAGTISSPKGSAPVVGPRIRALRDAMGLSLRDLAECSGVSAPMLSQVERGETSPTLAVAAKIAAGLELTLSQLLRLDEGQHVAISRASGRRRS